MSVARGVMLAVFLAACGGGKAEPVAVQERAAVAATAAVGAAAAASATAAGSAAESAAGAAAVAEKAAPEGVRVTVIAPSPAALLPGCSDRARVRLYADGHRVSCPVAYAEETSGGDRLLAVCAEKVGLPGDRPVALELRYAVGRHEVARVPFGEQRLAADARLELGKAAVVWTDADADGQRDLDRACAGI